MLHYLKLLRLGSVIRGVYVHCFLAFFSPVPRTLCLTRELKLLTRHGLWSVEIKSLDVELDNLVCDMSIEEKNVETFIVRSSLISSSEVYTHKIDSYYFSVPVRISLRASCVRTRKRSPFMTGRKACKM